MQYNVILGVIAAVAVGALKGSVIGAIGGAAVGATSGAIAIRISTGSWKNSGTAALSGVQWDLQLEQ